ncbi:MAG: class I SAM-dependent methyltransferase [Desulfobacterales bacterium]|nr:class I SAM-dependent methyltransferase [Desulfobacterales bacterium]
MEKQFEEQARMLGNRVKKRYKHLKQRYARQNLAVFRLYDWDIPEIRAVVDWYDGHLVIGEYSRKQSVPQWLPAMGKGVSEALGIPMDKVHLKVRKAGAQDGKRYQRLDHTDRKIPMAERDMKFLINLDDYVDTGLFSDHRNTRQRVRELVADKDFLNLYCYTGAFTIYAAKGGARSTLSVDRSETAIQWVGENLELNGLDGPEHVQIQKDTLDFLRDTADQGPSFDVAVVDPPSYSTTRSREFHFDIARDHAPMLNGVFHRMRPGGVVFFSTNHQNFTLHLEKLAWKDAREITHETIPEDFQSKRKQIHRCWEIRMG